ncbi:MAG: phytanoyl-CoA dioxygenase family protein [Verrucomicrobia bacterium]|nr:phytanoyl-CoA dioxygenase family protein [Verrucomicrobiota bacterium]MDA1069023.1 phytanoyl-CoA dioxygenase family protein [Verrucomicrobiota bacterium]
MPPTLTPQQVSSYERDGILFPIDVLSPAEVSRMANGLSEIEQRMGGKPKTVDFHQLFLNFRWAYDLVTHPKVLDAVESILGPDVLLWATSVFAKRPHDPGFISWHQDATYWGLDSGNVVTAWIALTESSMDNGCMRVAAGSHKMTIQPHRDTYAENNLLSRGQEIAVEVSDDEATDVILAPGQMSLHHVNIVHGSLPNSSEKKRIGFVARYMTPSVKHNDYHQPVILVRGQDTYGHFNLMQGPPDSDDLDVAVEAQLRTAHEHAAGTRKNTGAYEQPEK